MENSLAGSPRLPFPLVDAPLEKNFCYRVDVLVSCQEFPNLRSYTSEFDNLKCV